MQALPAELERQGNAPLCAQEEALANAVAVAVGSSRKSEPVALRVILKKPAPIVVGQLVRRVEMRGS